MAAAHHVVFSKPSRLSPVTATRTTAPCQRRVMSEASSAARVNVAAQRTSVKAARAVCDPGNRACKIH